MPNANDLNKLLDLRYEWEHSEIEAKPEGEKLYQAHFEAAYREAAAARPALSRHTFLMRSISFTNSTVRPGVRPKWERSLLLKEGSK